LGERITDISDILIALWDGVESGKEGGTSQIVSYKSCQKNSLYDKYPKSIKHKHKIPISCNENIILIFGSAISIAPVGIYLSCILCN